MDDRWDMLLTKVRSNPRSKKDSGRWHQVVYLNH